MAQTTYLFPREGKRREKLDILRRMPEGIIRTGERIFSEPIIFIKSLPYIGYAEVREQNSEYPFLVRAEDFEEFDMENIGEIAFNDSIDRP